jgi:hypothetical protein
MNSVARGEVMEIIHDYPELQEVSVQIEGSPEPERAYNYPRLYRKVKVGEIVFLNTIAIKLGLGTGGRHLVIPEPVSLIGESNNLDKGHIMKMRYTPWQFPVLAAEEEASPFHEQLKSVGFLNGIPVVIALLHSMIPGVILGFRNRWALSPLGGKKPKIAYIMTDEAALPIALSDLIRELKHKNLLELTITTGHAFGGDLETVSIPSALLAASQVGKADLIIVALGPGIVGTGTAFGFSGIEQSWVIDITARLKGHPIIVPRISEADPRERHLGISHHTLTILDFANHPASIAISNLLPERLKQDTINKLHSRSLLQRHFVYTIDDPPATRLFKEAEIQVKTMGRGINEELAFFQSSTAAGFLATEVVMNGLSSLTRLYG